MLSFSIQKLYQIAKANAGSQAIAKKPMNVIRNRYRDVLPSKLKGKRNMVGGVSKCGYRGVLGILFWTQKKVCFLIDPSNGYYYL